MDVVRVILSDVDETVVDDPDPGVVSVAVSTDIRIVPVAVVVEILDEVKGPDVVADDL